jgi:hypothetical protein
MTDSLWRGVAINDSARVDLESLLDAIERYLDAVETFRCLGCEPHWTDAPFLGEAAR